MKGASLVSSPSEGCGACLLYNPLRALPNPQHLTENEEETHTMHTFGMQKRLPGSSGLKSLKDLWCREQTASRVFCEAHLRQVFPTQLAAYRVSTGF